MSSFYALLPELSVGWSTYIFLFVVLVVVDGCASVSRDASDAALAGHPSPNIYHTVQATDIASGAVYSRGKINARGTQHRLL